MEATPGKRFFYSCKKSKQSEDMTFRELNRSDLNSALQQQVIALFGQLTNSRKALPLDDVLANNGQLTIVCCMEGDSLLGMASMATYRVVSGYKGWIEDVVVDHTQRGRGIGRGLVSRLLEKGKKFGLTEILLFTGVQRKPAMALYESLGFKTKDSRIYIYELLNVGRQ
jgi:phosphinothricin acetyltransferase